MACEDTASVFEGGSVIGSGAGESSKQRFDFGSDDDDFRDFRPLESRDYPHRLMDKVPVHLCKQTELPSFSLAAFDFGDDSDDDNEKQLELPNLIDDPDEQRLDVGSFAGEALRAGVDLRFARIPFIGGVSEQEVRVRQATSERSQFEQGSREWLHQVAADVYAEARREARREEWEHKDHMQALTRKREAEEYIEQLKEALVSAQQHAADAWNAGSHESQAPAPVELKPSKIGRALAFGLGAYAGAKSGDEDARRREAKRLSSDIARYAHEAAFANTDFSRKFAQAKVVELQARLVALNV